MAGEIWVLLLVALVLAIVVGGGVIVSWLERNGRVG